MPVDVLVLNTAVVDFRREEFAFADKLAAAGGLAKCETSDMPAYSQEQLAEWLKDGCAVPGGLGNTAPLMAMAGLKTAIGVNLGRDAYGGLDAPGRFFYDSMTACGIDMSSTFIHPVLPTGITFIHSSRAGERLGIAYFANANDDFSFECFKMFVERLKPSVVYYMYSGLSKRGDANEGRDLADFMRWCRRSGCIVLADSHTLTGSPQGFIEADLPLEGYKLLEPLLPELDIFFTSSDEAKLIHNTLIAGADNRCRRYDSPACFLNALTEKYCRGETRTRLFGVTVGDGAHEKHLLPDGRSGEPTKVCSRFMAGEVVDLVGAGDAFRAGVVAYIARNAESFRNGSMNFSEAVQLGNLFASLYIRAPLRHRYCVKPYEEMIAMLRGGRAEAGIEATRT